MNKNLILLLLFGAIIIKSQTYPPAVEVWSEPIRIDSLAERFIGEGNPSLSEDYSKLFLQKSAEVSMSHKMDTLWSLPIALNNNINNGRPIRNPNLNREGNRLYYCRWGGYGGWDLWYSEWDTLLNDWGLSINLGPNVNSASIEYFAYELSSDTLYCINGLWAYLGVCIYVKDNISNEWQIVDSSNYYHPFGMGDIRGLGITKDRRKAYFSKYISLISDSVQSELFVTFYDTTNNHWGDVYELNINSNAYQPDTTNNFYWIGGWDEWPWISSNGKLLFFHSNRDAAREDTTIATDIYMSILLIDENGNPVNVEEIPDLQLFLDDFILFQNYPNPFNFSTRIRYYIPEKELVSINIYDITGQEVESFENQEKQAGLYEIEFDGNGLTSGIYFYQLQAGAYFETKKMILLK